MSIKAYERRVAVKHALGEPAYNCYQVEQMIRLAGTPFYAVPTENTIEKRAKKYKILEDMAQKGISCNGSRTRYYIRQSNLPRLIEALNLELLVSTQQLLTTAGNMNLLT